MKNSRGRCGQQLGAVSPAPLPLTSSLEAPRGIIFHSTVDSKGKTEGRGEGDDERRWGESVRGKGHILLPAP